MKLRSLILVFLSVACVASAEDARELTLTPSEVDSLGIELASPSPVSAVEVGSGPAEVVIPPAQEAIVGATVSGILSRLLVAEGETVQAGQAMAEIQSPAFLTLQREFLDALASNELAQVQLQRDRGLHEEGIIAERRLQETAAAARVAAVALDQNRQQLGLAGMTEGELSRLVREQSLRSVLVLRAPLDGVVIEQLSALGARVNALDPVYLVADLSRLWLEVRVPQERAARIEPGFSAAVILDGRDVYAPVSHVGQVVDSTSQTVLVRALIENDGFAVRAGQYLHARILTGASEANVLVVPTSAVVWAGDERIVFVRTPDGFTANSFETIANDGVLTYVSSGIPEHSQIAVNGIAALKSVWLSSQAAGE